MAKMHFKYASMNSGKSIDLMRTAYNYEENGYNGLKNKPKGRPAIMRKKKEEIVYDDPKDKQLAELKQRNLELEAEVEALKKLRALVLQRNAQQPKKKQ